MQEEFLHYIWKYQKFNTLQFVSSDKEPIEIVNPGQYNKNTGPDFFNAKIRIGGQLWAGNVEIHIKASDWYAHHHEIDKAYDNVILHVVWVHDSAVYRNNNTEIPTLEIKPYVDRSLENNYLSLIKSKSWINCESNFSEVDDFLLDNWLDRLYVHRLERKSQRIQELLVVSNNDWEAVLFKMLFKNFGLKVNANSFKSISNSFDFSIVRKLQNNNLDIEALFFGQGKLLEKDFEESYFKDLKERYTFLRHKFTLDNSSVAQVNFFRLRPSSFPTIRLSQLANIYAQRTALFSKIIEMKELKEFYDFFGVGTSEFWKTHYTFSKSSKSSNKKLSKLFIDLLLINTIIPIKFSYAKTYSNSVEDNLLDLVQNIKIESNSIVNKFLDLKSLNKSALVSQALLELKQEYCDKNRCLYCRIGNSLILKK
ncbi:DUF2851 family protein [Winogradskyella sp. DF17]|uniref:DUF2851 family protein n=2 Tax=Winogradskyella pelagia TaxID=2819984 RepID=A0ABS3T4F9_9FLAO|nr:DUF2851 family protein [Winogradskyella sp. DF17]MBO3117627.1 DUF2851 family protein [Winogradskyella sp. DF17]